MSLFPHLGTLWFDHLSDPALRGGCLFAAAMFEFDARPGPLRALVSADVDRWIAGIESMIETARARAEIDRGVDAGDEALEFFTLGVTRRTYVAGQGPAMIVMTEFPGITPDVARFARRVRDAGFTVWLPSLFGRDGAAPTMEPVRETMGSGCVRREFTAFAAGTPSPMVGWLRQLAAHAHDRCGGPGVGAVGMRLHRQRRAVDDARTVDVPHSVVTTSLRDADGEPTVQARDAIIDLLRERLRG